jgi:hypothetical protein
MGSEDGQPEDMGKWLSPAEQATRMPVAWRQLLGDGKWGYTREWSEGANMRPIYEMTAEDLAALHQTHQ